MEFENGYYIMDLFEVLDAHNRLEAGNWLTSLQIESAQFMEKEDRSRFVSTLRKQAGIVSKTNAEFDKNGFLLLKRQLESGL